MKRKLPWRANVRVYLLMSLLAWSLSVSMEARATITPSIGWWAFNGFNSCYDANRVGQNIFFGDTSLCLTFGSAAEAIDWLFTTDPAIPHPQTRPNFCWDTPGPVFVGGTPPNQHWHRTWRAGQFIDPVTCTGSSSSTGSYSALQWGNSNWCPPDSTLSGGACQCSVGFTEVTSQSKCSFNPSTKNNGLACEANPCNPATGIKTQRETVYLAQGVHAVALELTYNSRLVNDTLLAWQGVFAKNWIGTYERRVRAGSNNAVAAVRPDGREWDFRPPQSGTRYLADADVSDVLDRLVDGGGGTTGWKLTAADGDWVETYDAAGKLLSIAGRSGIAQSLVYSDGTSGPNGGFVLDANGNPTTTVLPAGLLIRVTDFVGATLSFGYNAASRAVKLTDPVGQDTRFAYDANSNLVSITFPGSVVRTFHYNESAHTSGASLPNHLTGITDENSVRFATYKYDVQGRAISTEHAGVVNKYSFIYNANGTTDVTDPLNTARTYSFQNVLGVVKNTANTQPCVNCSAPHQNQSYDANGNVLSRLDWKDNRVCYGYDTTRNLETSRVEGLPSAATCPYTGALTGVQRKISTAWHATYRLPTQVAEPLRITTNVYGDPADPNPGNRGSLLSRTIQATTDTNGSAGFGATLTGTPRTWTYTYNAEGQVLTVNGPRTDVSDVTTYTYHANNATCAVSVPGASATGCRGQVASVSNALGHLTQITEYNAHGQPLLITDPNGLLTTLAYDTRMQLTSRNVGGELTTYTYDNAKQLTRVTMPDLSYLEYVYDDAHRLTEMRLRDSLNAIDGKIVYTLDAIGNRTAESVKDGADVVLQARTREYNSLNRLFKDIGGTNPAAQITEYGYDNQGNLTSRDGPLTGTVDRTTYTYDALNRLATMVDPAGVPGGTTTYGYNGLDQLAAVTDARSLQTVYTYDGLNNLTTQASPDTGNTVNTHDAAGNLSTSTDAKSQVTSYVYDALNRVTSITYQGAVVHTYQYDQGTNGLGRLTTIIEPNSTTQYGYNQKGRLTSETRTINGIQYVTGYSYDSAGRLTGLTYPGGRTVTYTLDGVGRIQLISTTKDSTTWTVLSSATYRPFGPMKSFTFGNGQTYTRGLDLDGRISSYTLATQTVPLCYDNASRITGLGGTGACVGGNVYGYDTLDRVLSYTGSAANQTFTYDAVGNRASKVVGAATDTYSFSPTSNRLTGITGANPRTYSHDNVGSITGDSINTFGYDTRGRLNQATSAIGATTYQVNSVGQRIRKTNTQGDTVYHYDAQGRLIAESSTSGQVQKEYIYLGDVPVAVIQ